jgi:hypothetical protein
VRATGNGVSAGFTRPAKAVVVVVGLPAVVPVVTLRVVLVVAWTAAPNGVVLGVVVDTTAAGNRRL